MAVLTVFNDNLSPSFGSLTNRFTKAVGFYIDAPLITTELEIDVFLQVYFPTATGERVRNLPLGKLKDGQIALNETDTESLVTIPNEFVNSDLEMALFFLGSSTTFLEVYVIGANCTLCQIKNDVEVGFTRVDQRLDGIETTLNQILTAIDNPGVPALTSSEILFLIS